VAEKDDALDGLTDSLGKEVGGIPVWVIGGGIGLLIGVIYWFYRQRSGGVAVSTYDPTSGDAGSDDSTSDEPSAYSSWLNDNVGSSAVNIGTGVNEIPSPITNGQWARQVIDGLIGLGDDPSLVANAINKYIAGKGLTKAEKSVVNLALQKYGSTPEGPLQVIDVTANPTEGVTPRAGSQRGYGWYQVKNGDSASSIAKKYSLPLASFYVYNGGARLIAGQWVKVRLDSNPVLGYNGR
jgi:LysM repeat protein